MTAPSKKTDKTRVDGPGKQDATRQRELPDEIPGIDEESQERWGDESPATTLARPGSGVGPTPLA